MACTTLTVTSAAKTVVYSNLGFGDNTTAFAVCTTLAGTPANAYLNYVITNPGASNTLGGIISYINPAGTMTERSFSMLTTVASGILRVPLGFNFTAGNYSGLTISAPTVT